jgi:hypothetical protein
MGRAMSADDDTGDSGGTLPDNLFAPRRPREHEALPGAMPIGLGGTSATAMPALLVPLLGDRLLSPAERVVVHIRAAIEACLEDGDEAKAAALRKLNAPKRARGRPPEWSDHDRFHLAIAVGEELRADPALSGSAACDAVAGRPEWQGFSGDALQKQLSLFADHNGLKFGPAIDKLRGAPKSRR